LRIGLRAWLLPRLPKGAAVIMDKRLIPVKKRPRTLAEERRGYHFYRLIRLTSIL
jgi:hypothetical protein